MHKPKIIVCATAYHPFVGGSEIAIQEVAGRLVGRLDFYVLTARMSRALPRREVRPEAVIVRLGFGTRFDKWLLPFLIPWHLRSKFQSPIQSGTSSKLLLWGMDIGQGALGAAMAKCLYPSIPFVLTVQYGESPEHLRHGRAGLIARVFRFMLGRADRVTAISSYLLGVARDHGFCGSAEVISNGADIGKFKTENEKGKTIYQDAKIIITVSRLVAKNGIDTLIRAFAEVKKEIPDAFLHIVGEGPERDAFEKLAKEAGVREAVTFFGGVSHDALPQYLHQADVFVRASRSEGMGSAFVEAMAAGLPVIGTAVGGIPDVIAHEKTGLLALPENPRDLAACMIRIWRDPECAERLAAAGKEEAMRQFDWDAIAPSYGKIFFQEISAKKRVVIATGLFPPEIGGPATYSQFLVDGLPQQGVGIRVVPFRSVRRFPKIVRHLVYFLNVISAGRGSDIIFALDPVSVGLPALCAARLMRKKFLLKIVGDYAWEQLQVKNEKRKIKNGNAGSITVEEFQKGRYDMMTELRRSIQRFVARGAARIIVPSEYLKGIVIQWGVPEGKVTVIYNAVDPPRDAPSRKEARTALAIPADAFLIVSAGRLVPWKGFGELIGAMAAIRRDIPQARLVIVGSGPDEGVLRRKIKEKQAGDIVSLAGSVSHETFLRHLRTADLFVLNSSYEGFSHTLLEAMAMEVPVMASDAGGNNEIIADGVSGRLYSRCDAASLADEIIRLYRDPQARERFAQAGKPSLARFSSEAMLIPTINLLK